LRARHDARWQGRPGTSSNVAEANVQRKNSQVSQGRNIAPRSKNGRQKQSVPETTVSRTSARRDDSLLANEHALSADLAEEQKKARTCC
jgi:hypothetical protein